MNKFLTRKEPRDFDVPHASPEELSELLKRASLNNNGVVEDYIPKPKHQEVETVVDQARHSENHAGPNALPHPFPAATYAWRIAWFMRAMRTEDMRDMATSMAGELKAQLGERQPSTSDIIDWLIGWARKQHGLDQTTAENKEGES